MQIRVTVQKKECVYEQGVTFLTIAKEWQKEYIGEGQMFYYYKRLGLPIPNATAGGDAAFILPLPKNEVEMGGREDYKNDK